MNEPLVAGVDSSTQSTKVELRAARTGELVATGRATHPSTHPPHSEQHPDDWWSALVAAMDQCGSARSRVAAIAVAGLPMRWATASAASPSRSTTSTA